MWDEKNGRLEMWELEDVRIDVLEDIFTRVDWCWNGRNRV